MTENEKNRTELVANSRWYLTANVIGSLYVFMTIPILTHSLSAGEFGFYILINQIVFILQTVGLTFFSQSLFRFHIEQEGEARQVFYGTILSSVVGVSLFLSGILFFWRQDLVSFLYPNVNLPLDPYVGWACVWLVLTTIRALTLTKIKAEERPDLAMWMILSYGMFLTVALYSMVLKSDGGLAGALTSFVMAEAGALLCVGLYVWRGVRLAWDAKILGSVTKFSLSLAASSSLFALSANMDRKVLSEYVSLEELGLYGIGFMVGNSLSLVVSSYAGAFTARGLKLWKKEGRRPLEELIHSGMRDCLPVAGLALGGVMVFGSYLAQMLNRGNAEGPLVAIASGVGAGHVVRLIYIHAQNVLFIGERTEKILMLNAGLLLTTWLMAHIFCKTGSPAAVALTMACSYLLFMPLAFSLTKSICSIRLPWKQISRLGLGLAMIASLEFIMPKFLPGTLMSEAGRKTLQIIVLIPLIGISVPEMVKAAAKGLQGRTKQSDKIIDIP